MTHRMPKETKPRRKNQAPVHQITSGSLLGVLGLAILNSCSSPPPPKERLAREQVAQIGHSLLPGHGQIPTLGPDSRLGDYVSFAVAKHPAVFAAYADWRASIEAIHVSRSLPDPLGRSPVA